MTVDLHRRLPDLLGAGVLVEAPATRVCQPVAAGGLAVDLVVILAGAYGAGEVLGSLLGSEPTGIVPRLLTARGS